MPVCHSTDKKNWKLGEDRTQLASGRVRIPLWICFSLRYSLFHSVMLFVGVWCLFIPALPTSSFAWTREVKLMAASLPPAAILFRLLVQFTAGLAGKSLSEHPLPGCSSPDE
jgi:hypothetical protein